MALRWNKVQFTHGIVDATKAPQFPFPEIAFFGRSNVGKSSLINALFGQKIAKTSSTPGRTQQLNFFNVADQLIVVDLPGYGYAKASKRDIDQWNDLTFTYLTERTALKRLFLLIDSRRGLKDIDRDVMTTLEEHAVPYQIVLTKIDKIPKREQESVISAVQSHFDEYTALLKTLLVTSGEKKDGIDTLKHTIEGLV